MEGNSRRAIPRCEIPNHGWRRASLCEREHVRRRGWRPGLEREPLARPGWIARAFGGRNFKIGKICRDRGWQGFVRRVEWDRRAHWQGHESGRRRVADEGPDLVLQTHGRRESRRESEGSFHQVCGDGEVLTCSTDLSESLCRSGSRSCCWRLGSCSCSSARSRKRTKGFIRRKSATSNNGLSWASPSSAIAFRLRCRAVICSAHCCWSTSWRPTFIASSGA